MMRADETRQKRAALVRDDARGARIVEDQTLAQHDLRLGLQRRDRLFEFGALGRVVVHLAFGLLLGEGVEMVEPLAGIGQLFLETGPRSRLALEGELDIADTRDTGPPDELLQPGLEDERLLLVHLVAEQDLQRLAEAREHLAALRALLIVLHHGHRFVEAGRQFGLGRDRHAGDRVDRRRCRRGDLLRHLPGLDRLDGQLQAGGVFVPDREIHLLAALRYDARVLRVERGSALLDVPTRDVGGVIVALPPIGVGAVHRQLHVATHAIEGGLVEALVVADAALQPGDQIGVLRRHLGLAVVGRRRDILCVVEFVSHALETPGVATRLLLLAGRLDLFRPCKSQGRRPLFALALFLAFTRPPLRPQSETQER